MCFLCHMGGQVRLSCPQRKRGRPKDRTGSETDPKEGVVKTKAPEGRGSGTEGPQIKKGIHTGARQATVEI